MARILLFGSLTGVSIHAPDGSETVGKATIVISYVPFQPTPM
ncbi:hypothetical protein [Azospirillum oryzae]|nr:hypothetical protein [Azospirillum oryzae]GLR81413.1 hypothetical protein GCM10007856_40990 [Azospirillum oryzae]